jgi:hypothetical protein
MTGLGVGNEELFSIVVQVDGGRGGLLWLERECDPLLELGPGQTAWLVSMVNVKVLLILLVWDGTSCTGVCTGT